MIIPEHSILRLLTSNFLLGPNFHFLIIVQTAATPTKQHPTTIKAIIVVFPTLIPLFFVASSFVEVEVEVEPETVSVKGLTRTADVLVGVDEEEADTVERMMDVIAPPAGLVDEDKGDDEEERRAELLLVLVVVMTAIGEVVDVVDDGMILVDDAVISISEEVGETEEEEESTVEEEEEEGTVT